MMARSNACSELTRFWLEARHGCLITESVPVPVPYGQSDLDLVAIQAAQRPILVPGGASIGPRLIVEAKDEHDWEPTGREFGRLLRTDLSKMGQAHFETAAQMLEPRTLIAFSSCTRSTKRFSGSLTRLWQPVESSGQPCL